MAWSSLTQTNPRVVVCIPAYNEERTIAKVIVKARTISDLILVCDDGSSDMTAEIARSLKVQLLSNSRNQGKGHSLGALMRAAQELKPDVVVTIDGDDQHDPREIPKIIEPVLNGKADIVIGLRSLTDGSMPRNRIWGNMVLDRLTSSKAGETLHDTQSGFRAYSPSAVGKLNFDEKGMATESQTLIDATSLGLKIDYVPVSVRYDGIPRKRNPVWHLSEVVDYVITRTVIESPLLYLGLPGLVAVILGLIAGLRVVEIFSSNHSEIAVGTGLIAAILLIGGTVAMATSLILKLLTARIQNER